LVARASKGSFLKDTQRSRTQVFATGKEERSPVLELWVETVINTIVERETGSFSRGAEISFAEGILPDYALKMETHSLEPEGTHSGIVRILRAFGF